jgi:uncharacterized membrane protein YciS (DUF1049 family)
MLRTRILVLLLLAFLLAMLFVALNPQVVTLELVLWHGRVRLGLALMLTLALGFVLGVAVRAAWLGDLLRERGRLRRALKAAETRALSSQNRVGS